MAMKQPQNKILSRPLFMDRQTKPAYRLSVNGKISNVEDNFSRPNQEMVRTNGALTAAFALQIDRASPGKICFFSGQPPLLRRFFCLPIQRFRQRLGVRCGHQRFMQGALLV